MTNTQHKGSCHCGAVTFEMECEIDHVLECNCSICRRVGWQLVFVPHTHLRITAGSDKLTDYQFGNKHIHHAFCSNCGIRTVGWGADGDGNKMYSVNTRCLDDFDVTNVEIRHYDGAAL